MNRTSNNGSCAGRSKVVEIVGPAGAGKSTLYRALNDYPDRVRLGNFPDVHKWADAPFYIFNGIQLIPNLIRLPRSNSRQLTRREFAWLSILHGWSTRLRNELQRDNKTIILDQGPIYLLAEIFLFGPEYLRRNSADKFWQALYQHWGATLDMVILLDAADDILLERIRTREQGLVVKDQPAIIVYDYLNRYRAEYEFLLSILAAKNINLKVLRIDTAHQQPQDILKQFLSDINC